MTVQLPGDLSAFEREARAFIERTLPSLNWPQVKDAGPHRHVLLHNDRSEDALVPVAREWRAAKFDAGYGWISGPPAFGGGGLPEAFEHRFGEIEREYGVPNEDCFVFGLEGAAIEILRSGSEALKRECLPRIFRGDWIVCQLYSEPGAGSDLASISTRAVRKGDEWIINGQKLWSSGAHRADVGLLLCRTGTPEQRHRGLTAFIVDIKSPGLETRPLRQMDGGTGFNEVFFTDVSMPDRRRLGEIDAGWSIAMSVQANARSLLAQSRRRGANGGLAAVASAERLAAIMHRLGRQDDAVLRQAWARLYTIQTLLEPTAARLSSDQASPHQKAAAGAISKLALANALSQAAELLWSLLGNRLVADAEGEDSFEWSRFVLQVMGYHIGGGTDEVLKNVIARRGLGLPQ